jgi:hypothetical protein
MRGQGGNTVPLAARDEGLKRRYYFIANEFVHILESADSKHSSARKSIAEDYRKIQCALEAEIAGEWLGSDASKFHVAFKFAAVALCDALDSRSSCRNGLEGSLINVEVSDEQLPMLVSVPEVIENPKRIVAVGVASTVWLELTESRDDAWRKEVSSCRPLLPRPLEPTFELRTALTDRETDNLPIDKASFLDCRMPGNVIKNGSEIMNISANRQARKSVDWWNPERAVYVLSRLGVSLHENRYRVSFRMLPELAVHKVHFEVRQF